MRKRFGPGQRVDLRHGSERTASWQQAFAGQCDFLPAGVDGGLSHNRWSAGVLKANTSLLPTKIYGSAT